jgi:GNAT superfamily N-acetyltransferase
MNSEKRNIQFPIIMNPIDDDIKQVRNGLEEHNKTHPHGKLDIPAPDISLILRDKDDLIIGGVITSMMTGVMHLETLWVDEKHRRKGLGSLLVLEAERLGKAKGYPTSQTWTFSFQAPKFYPSIGYKRIATFDGYTNGITEDIFMKRLDKPHPSQPKQIKPELSDFTIHEDATKESMKVIYERMYEYVDQHIGDRLKMHPDTQLNFVIKKPDGQVIGGLLTRCYLKAMYINQLWVHKSYRGRGYGSELVNTAEQKAKENGCISILASVLSFQSPEFFQKIGFQSFGESDGYPYPTKEFYFIKRI